MRKKRKIKDSDGNMVAWHINKFPEDLKNRLCGLAKTDGKHIPEYLAEVIAEYLKGK